MTHKRSTNTPRTGKELLLILAKKQQALLLKREKTLKRQIEEYMNAGPALISLIEKRSFLINQEHADVMDLIKSLDTFNDQADHLKEIMKVDFMKLNERKMVAQSERENLELEIEFLYSKAL